MDKSGRDGEMGTKTADITSEVCAYCREWEQVAPERCRYNSRGHGEHRFEEIEMNPRLAGLMLELLDLDGAPLPNFWHGFDVENVRLAEDDGTITMFVFDGSVSKGILAYRVDFTEGTPFALIETTFGETAMAAVFDR